MILSQASNTQVQFYFKKEAAQGGSGQAGLQAQVELRAAHLTQGDKILVSPVHLNCAPPPDLEVAVKEWSGSGCVTLPRYPVVPGDYAISYVSRAGGGIVLGSTTLRVDFAAPSALTSTAMTREMRLFCCLEAGASTEDEYQLLTSILQYKLHRMCEQLSLSFTLRVLGQVSLSAADACDGTCVSGLCLQ